ncbi:class I SAM-dependent methyltransferase, partial [Acinetobacter baumannii]
MKILQRYPHIACDLLDLSAPMLERARERVSQVTDAPVRTLQADFRTAPLEADTYDLIVAAAVL